MCASRRRPSTNTPVSILCDKLWICDASKVKPPSRPVISRLIPSASSSGSGRRSAGRPADRDRDHDRGLSRTSYACPRSLSPRSALPSLSLCSRSPTESARSLSSLVRFDPACGSLKRLPPMGVAPPPPRGTGPSSSFASGAVCVGAGRSKTGLLAIAGAVRVGENTCPPTLVVVVAVVANAVGGLMAAALGLAGSYRVLPWGSR